MRMWYIDKVIVLDVQFESETRPPTHCVICMQWFYDQRRDGAAVAWILSTREVYHEDDYPHGHHFWTLANGPATLLHHQNYVSQSKRMVLLP